jgi:hypothetical protein
MHRIDALHLEHPFAGSRMLRDLLRREGVTIGRRTVCRCLRGARRSSSRTRSMNDATRSSFGLDRGA